MQSNVGVRLRLRYSKRGKVRFVSHRDGARLWERALRRAELPAAFTEGFTPRPKLGFGLALPTGAESIAEYLDIDLHRDAGLDPFDPSWSAWTVRTAAALTDAMPPGYDVDVVVARDPSAGSLQEQVDSTTWELTGWESAGPGRVPEPLESAAQRLLAADELLVERERKGRRRVDDVRPLIRDLRPDPSGRILVADLVTTGRALRPSELAELVVPGIDALGIRVLRTAQWVDDPNGERVEVIEATALSASSSSDSSGVLVTSGPASTSEVRS